MTVDCRGTTTAPLVFHVKENVPGALIGQVLPNNGTTITMSGTQFLIVNQQDVPDIAIMDDGSLYAPEGLDRETRQNYSITVIAESLRSVGVFQVLNFSISLVKLRRAPVARFLILALILRMIRCGSSWTTKTITRRNSR